MTEIQDYNYCLEVIELKKNIEVAFLGLGERLMKIRDMSLFHSQWETFEDYLDEIKMSPSVASRIITVYKTFVLDYQLEPQLIANAGGWSNAYEISKLTKSKDEAVQLLSDSALRTPKDTKDILRELKTGISQEDCKHDWVEIRFCKICNTKEKLYDGER